MKSLIILTPGFPSHEGDSTCLPTQQNLVRAFNALDPGLEIIILSIQYPYVTAEYKWFGNSVKTYNGKNLNSIGRIKLWFSIYRDIKKIYKRENMMGILSFWCGETALIGHWFAKFYPIAHFCWVCGQDARKENPFVKFMKLVPNELVAISKFIQEEFERNHKIAPAHLGENGIVKAEHKDTKSERHIDVIGVGSLTTLKQYKMFVDVIERLAKAREVRAVICGSGPERLTLSKKIDSCGLKNTISLAGEISNEEVKRYLRQSKILLHPSSYEGYSTACLEALHAGCFVISLTHPGNVDSNRWLVVRSVDEMYNTCNQLLASENLEFIPTTLNTIDDTALKFIDLFNQQSKS
jgi:glycosyltransferase involved in cell wall biosynthesis